MELNNEFRVAVPPAKAWEVLTDVARVAPCLPGATLLSVDGDQFTGAVKIKVGPITVAYQGIASFQEKDAAAQRVVLKANGKETRGNGNAAAVVTAALKDEGPTTTVITIATDLTISGKAAQFGRGVLADVATNLVAQFAQRLEADLLESAPAGTVGQTPSAAAKLGAAELVTGRVSKSARGDSIDLLTVVALPLAKRAVPVLVGLIFGATVGFVLGRRA